MGEIKKTLEYEIISNLEIFGRMTTWINILAVLFFIFVLYKQYTLALLCLLIITILNFKLHHDTGEVEAYYRKKHKIPTKGEIKKMKAQIKNEQSQD